MALARALEWNCRLSCAAAGRVRGHLEGTRSRLSPSRGGEREKSELRRRGFGSRRVGEEKSKRLRHDAELRRREEGAWMRRRRCCRPLRQQYRRERRRIVNEILKTEAASRPPTTNQIFKIVLGKVA